MLIHVHASHSRAVWHQIWEASLQALRCECPRQKAVLNVYKHMLIGFSQSNTSTTMDGYDSLSVLHVSFRLKYLMASWQCPAGLLPSLPAAVVLERSLTAEAVPESPPLQTLSGSLGLVGLQWQSLAWTATCWLHQRSSALGICCCLPAHSARRQARADEALQAVLGQPGALVATCSGQFHRASCRGRCPSCLQGMPAAAWTGSAHSLPPIQPRACLQRCSEPTS